MMMILPPVSKRDSIVLTNHSQCFSNTIALFASSAFLIKSSMIIMSAPNPVAVPVGDVAR